MGAGESKLPARRDTPGPVARLRDEEAARILKRASRTELLDHVPTPHDLTLEDLVEVAAEVGLDPGAVRRAAAVHPSVASGAQRLIFGGATDLSVRAVAGRDIPSDRTPLVRTAEAVLGRTGKETESKEEAWGWETAGSVGHTSVQMRQTGDGTEIALRSNRAGILAMTYLPLLVGVGAVSGGLGLFASAVAAAGPLAALAGLFGLPFLLARPLFRRLDASAQDRMEQLAMELLRVVEESGDDADDAAD